MQVARTIVAILLIIVFTGCAGKLTRPDTESLEQPRPVFLLDHGRHSSLVLTREDQSMVRYLYGEWRWYALQETGPLRAFPTLFAPTRAALGRRELAGPPDARVIRRQIPVVIDTLHELPVEATRVDRLIQELDERFEAARETRHENRAYDLEFVHHPKDYTVFDNSNHVVAEWLRELGLEVSGNPMWGTWRVE